MKIELEASPAFFTFIIPIICLFLGHFLKKFHLAWFPESVGTMMIGFIFGAIHYYVFPFVEVIEFQPEIFLYVLLPPIIFEGGFSMKKKGMFNNLGTILMFAILGTLFSVFVIGISLFFLAKYGVIHGISGEDILEPLIFGALISSTDPVATLSIMGEVFHVDEKEHAPLVYNLVFGESMLNDAVAIVAYRTLINLYVAHHQGTNSNSTGSSSSAGIPEEIGFKALATNFVPITTSEALSGMLDFAVIGLGSVVVAFVVCAIAALLYKHTGIKEHYSSEVLCIYLFAGVAYSLSELIGLSGIIAVFFAGLFMSHYTWYNLGAYAQITTRTTFKLFAFLSEVIIFVFLGSSPFLILHEHIFDLSFIGLATIIMIAARFLQTAIFSNLANLRRKQKISWKTQFFIFWAGLRGSIAFALAFACLEVLPVKHAQSIIATTVAIVMVTNVVMGGLTAPLLRLTRYMEEIAEEEYIPIGGGSPSGSGTWGSPSRFLSNDKTDPRKSYIPNKMSGIDKKYIKPFLTCMENERDSESRKTKMDRGEYQMWVSLI